MGRLVSSLFLPIERPLVVLDAETTGPQPREDRIVELSLLRLEPGGVVAVPEVYRINPVKFISPGATEVHGITDDDVKDCPMFSELAGDLRAKVSGCDLLGFGIARFDVPLLVAEFSRVGQVWEPEGLVIDAMRIFHHFYPRNLEAAVREYCDMEHADAHTAEADVLAALLVFEMQVQRHELPSSLAAIRELISPEEVEWSGRVKRDTEGMLRFTFGKHAGAALSGIPGDYLMWMLKQDFGPTLNGIIREELGKREATWPTKR